MKNSRRDCLLIFALLIYCSAFGALADNWPAWRGAKGLGISGEKQLPLHWGTNQNIGWRTPLPERGNSTPIVWNNRVYITQAIEKEKRRMLMCFDRANGN